MAHLDEFVFGLLYLGILEDIAMQCHLLFSDERVGRHELRF